MSVSRMRRARVAVFGWRLGGDSLPRDLVVIPSSDSWLCPLAVKQINVVLAVME